MAERAFVIPLPGTFPTHPLGLNDLDPPKSDGEPLSDYLERAVLSHPSVRSVAGYEYEKRGASSGAQQWERRGVGIFGDKWHIALEKLNSILLWRKCEWDRAPRSQDVANLLFDNAAISARTFNISEHPSVWECETQRKRENRVAAFSQELKPALAWLLAAAAAYPVFDALRKDHWHCRGWDTSDDSGRETVIGAGVWKRNNMEYIHGIKSINQLRPENGFLGLNTWGRSSYISNINEQRFIRR
jgi:hypothetical protein